MAYIVLAPVITRTLEGPHVVGLCFGVDELGVEAMLLFDEAVDRQVIGTDVLVRGA